MSASELHRRSVAELRSDVVAGRVSAEELARHYLERIARLDGRLNSYITVDAEGALQQAIAVDRGRARNDAPGALCGVPIAVKDNLCTCGLPTTCASRILQGYVPPYDAHVVEKLRAAGAVILGKLNMDEFAMGSSNENSCFGPARNPWDTERTPGGSSGGPAAATAAFLAAAALGSDTGGSVRQPASFCGVTAIKPTYGRVSRYGLVAFASSLDQVGPIARNAADAALLLGVIAGHDERDATSVTRQTDDYAAECGRPVRGLRVGIARDALEQGCDPEVVAAIDNAIKILTDLGCEPVDVSLPHASYGVSAYYIVAPAEASSNLARYDGMRYGLRVAGEDLFSTYGRTRARGFGAEVKRRIMLGTYALSAGYYDAFYLRAQKVRTLIWRDFASAFERCEVLLTPTAPTPAFKLGEKLADPLSMYLQDIFTLPVSLAGVPAVSTPCGLSAGGLPIGMQLCAPAFEEKRLVRVAHAFEQVLGWPERKPSGWD
jgi:aspartyl-tRNA(Asn)/glutamyl-tRNA(Gln) amidotransferase subunit A